MPMNFEKAPMARRSVHIEKSVLEVIDDLAKLHGVTSSHVIRECIHHVWPDLVASRDALAARQVDLTDPIRKPEKRS